MGGVAQRHSRGLPPQQQVAGHHGRWCDEGGTRPAAVERGERRHAEDVGGEAVARERDPVAPRERADRHEGDELGPEAGTEHGLSPRVRAHRCDDREHGGERDERPHERAGRGHGT